MANRSTHTRLIRAAAVVVGLATIRVVANDLADIDAHAHSLGTEITVVIAQHEIPLGATVATTDVQTVQRYQSQVPADAIRAAPDVVGRVVRVPLVAGAPVQRANLALSHRDPVLATRSSDLGNATTSAAIPPGFRVLRVVDSLGMVPTAGSVVDVLATPTNPTSAPGDVPADTGGSNTTRSNASRIVARGAIVLPDSTESSRASRVTNTSRTRNDSAATGIMLLVRDVEARAIASAAATGVVSIVLAPLEEACCADRSTSSGRSGSLP